MVNLSQYKPTSPLIVRVALSLVFLWFGLNQLFDSRAFLGYVPDFVPKLLSVDPSSLVFLNGLLDTFLGTFLLIGLFTRTIALLAVLHLIMVITGLGYNDIAVRDFGLMLISFSVFVHGPDPWTFDVRVLEKVKRSVKGASGSLSDIMGIKIKVK